MRGFLYFHTIKHHPKTPPNAQKCPRTRQNAKNDTLPCLTPFFRNPNLRARKRWWFGCY